MEDLFYNTDQLPTEVIQAIDSFDENEDTYFECERILKEVEALGYTFDYGLDGVPFNLRHKVQLSN